MASDDQLRGIRAKLEAKLSGFNARLVEQTDGIDLGGAVAAELIDQLAGIPGALSVAADLASTSMFRGLGDTFDANSGDVDSGVGGGGGSGWDYTAVMDGGTCEVCETWDGTHFDTWEEIAGAGGPLPDGGPNPDCFGGDRCRCRPTIA